MRKSLLLIFMISFLFCSCKNVVKKDISNLQPTRGVWLTNVVSDAMFSKENIEKAVDICSEYGFNTIYVVTWNRGYTLYPSKIMDRHFGIPIDPKHEGRDPLKEVISAAHKKDIKVIAWFEFGFSSSYEQPSGGHIIEKFSHWAARDTVGNIVSKNRFQWMNAFDPGVQAFILSLLKEVANNYDIDGIQGDDRLPALPSMAGYDSLTVEKYKLEHNGQLPPKDIFDKNWVQWRADILSKFMKRMYHEIKTIDSSLVVSVSPSIYPWSKEEYLQAWPTWVENGWVDQVCPQIYRYDIEKYKLELEKIMTEQVAAKNHSLIAPGILLRVGDYYASDTLLQQMISANRKYGIDGEVFFYFEGLKKRASFFENY